MEYPKYKREEKLSAKLSKEDVLTCERLREQGYSFRKIGDFFNVSSTCIFLVCMTETQKKKYSEYFKNYRIKNKINNTCTAKKFRKRKLKLKKEKMVRWENERSNDYYKNNKETVRKQQIEYRKKNKEKMKEYAKKYYRENRNHYLDMFKKRYKRTKS